MAKKELGTRYNPREIETSIYQEWLNGNFFHARIDTGKPKFSMVIPPPNVTGSLHMGHALNNTLQDIIVRKKRMEGLVTLWLPGTDHAGIATQNVVERELAKEGLTRQKIGREKFVKRVWQWKEEYGKTIINQLKRLGASCDWERERFTMDEGCSKAVRRAFVTLYNDGLIYRGKYIVNWCPRCLTALSDIEVEHEETEGKLYYIKYDLLDRSGYLTIATTRPETMLGDTALAVNPEDPRYKKYIGRVAILPLLGRELPVIADEYVDMDFGTGVLKVTPAHDPNDFIIGKKHNLKVINVFTEEAVVNEHGGYYQGLSRENARERIIEDLIVKNQLEKIEDFTHAIGHCYRCHTPIEPFLSTQWFVRMKPLAEPAIHVVREGKIRFFPEKYENIYYEWLENIRDWCISRQLWWGHRIPVWYCNSCGEIIVSEEDVRGCKHCRSDAVVQDEDVLDTWFSSALWPFSTLGWPEDTEDLRYFYPTDLLVTGHDIIFFWVARMVMMGLKLVGDIPFKHVHIHTLVRDAYGQKMSKSKGNVIDPVVMIEKYGADALRFTLAHLAVPGGNIYLSEEKIEGSRNFANKIWNASRFILMNLSEEASGEISNFNGEFGLAERWILSRLAKTVKEVNSKLEVYNFARAAGSIYDFFWSDFCDIYLELSKIAIYQGTRSRKTVENVLLYVLKTSLSLLHPFMPFLTEGIYSYLPGIRNLLVVSNFPEEAGNLDEEAEKAMGRIIEAVRAIRSLKADVGLPNIRGFKVFMKIEKDGEVFIENKDYIELLTQAATVDFVSEVEKPDGSLTAVFTDGEAYIPFGEAIDFSSVKSKLEKKIKEIQLELKKVERKLSNDRFLRNADPNVVEKEKRKVDSLTDQLTRFEKLLQEL